VNFWSNALNSLSVVVIASIELKWLLYPTTADPVEAERLYGLAREFATREVTYQKMWYLHILRRQVGTRVGLVQVNEYFSRLLVLDDETIGLEVDPMCVSLPNLPTAILSRVNDSSTFTSHPRLLCNIDELDTLSIWSRPVNSLISLSQGSNDHRLIDPLGWERFSAFFMSSLFLAASLDPHSHPNLSPHFDVEPPPVPPHDIAKWDTLGRGEILRAGVSTEGGCVSMARAHAMREEYGGKKPSVIRSWAKKKSPSKRADVRRGEEEDDEGGGEGGGKGGGGGLGGEGYQGDDGQGEGGEDDDDAEGGVRDEDAGGGGNWDRDTGQKLQGEVEGDCGASGGLPDEPGGSHRLGNGSSSSTRSNQIASADDDCVAHPDQRQHHSRPPNSHRHASLPPPDYSSTDSTCDRDWRHYADLLTRHCVMIRLVTPEEMDRMLGCLTKGEPVAAVISTPATSTHTVLGTIDSPAAFPANPNNPIRRECSLSGDMLSSSLSNESDNELAATPSRAILFRSGARAPGGKGADRGEAARRTVGFNTVR